MMTLKRALVVCGVGIAGLSAGLIQAGDTVDTTVGTYLKSAYVWRGQTVSDDPVMQPSVDLAHQSGLGLNLWGNLDLGDSGGEAEEGEFSEVDLTVSFALPTENLNASIGAIYYMYPRVSGDGETAELFLSLGHSVDAVSLGADIFWDVDEFKDAYASLSASVNVPLTADFSVDVGGAVGIAGKDAAGFGGSGFADWNLSISTARFITETVELGAFIAYTDTFDSDVLPDQETDVYGGVSLFGAL